jgi:hypothetical protein
MSTTLTVAQYEYALDTDETVGAGSDASTIAFTDWSSVGETEFFFQGMTGDVTIFVKDAVATGGNSTTLVRVYQVGDNYGHGEPFAAFDIANGADVQVGPLSPIRYCNGAGLVRFKFDTSGSDYSAYSSTFSGKVAVGRNRYGAT